MGRGERCGDVARGPQDVGMLRPLESCYFLAERPPVHIFGGNQQLAVELLERVNGADAGMGEARRRPCLSLQSLAMRRIPGEPGCDRLERDLPSQARITRQINPAHPAATELTHDHVHPRTYPGG